MPGSLSASPPIYRRDQLDWPEEKQLHSLGLNSVAQLTIIAATAVKGLCDGDSDDGDDNGDSVRQRRRRRRRRHRDGGVQHRIP